MGSTSKRPFASLRYRFHLVTAFDILRHHGVDIGRKDYLGQRGRCIRPKKT